jgi:hypothetical protein
MTKVSAALPFVIPSEAEGPAVRPSPKQLLAPLPATRMEAHSNQRETYSVRSAVTGSIEAARCAGIMLANKAHTASATIDPPRTNGSQPRT